ncbi:RICIN domain-containing protein [Glycomyces luteolus]|uniref:RICIN domain-containing protein n=1 Tax=Glycomyces luteolus TaxID=2670330 RepID=A0A9X3PGD2_9ACTN|nr:RICIN domain-containing protein [Glycomyces luteolus]MDA1362119.1 RICIN domain-containing protein [Glycomyces luteolus]
MKTFLLNAAAVSAAILLAVGAPAHAQSVPVPDGGVKLFLKDHPDLPMAVVDGVPRLTDEGDLWELGGDEADMQDLGEYQIIHRGSGQCLVADTGGGATAHVSLADCADAHSWTIVYDNPGHRDFRFVAPGDYLLGLHERSDAVEGAEVLAVREDPSDSMHFHEWLTESGTATPPPNEITPVPDPSFEAESPASAAAAAAAESASPKPALPTTGAGLGIGIGAGAVALAGGAALMLWWQRRRVLRADW